MRNAIITIAIPQDSLGVLLKAYSSGVQGLGVSDAGYINNIIKHIVDQGQAQKVLTNSCTLAPSRRAEAIAPMPAEPIRLISGAAIRASHEMPLMAVKEGDVFPLEVEGLNVTSGHRVWALPALIHQVNQGAWWFCARYKAAGNEA